jgi:hypothetical protein
VVDAPSRRRFLRGAAGAAGGLGLAGLLGGLASACGGDVRGGPGGGTGTSARPVARGSRTGWPEPGMVPAGDLASPDTLGRSVERMVGFGPRLTGSDAHRRYIDSLEEQLESFGLRVTRWPVSLYAWLARSWSLRVEDADGGTHEIPVASYRPHSGETPPRGMTGGLLDLGAGGEDDYRGKDARGRIVLLDTVVSRLPAAVWSGFADYLHPPGLAGQLPREDYTRVWLGVPPPPSLQLAKRHGAVAAVDVLDLPPALAAGQYTPHQQDYAGLPTVALDRVQGRRLRDLLRRGPVTATVVLDAVHRRTTVDYLGAHLPGRGTRDATTGTKGTAVTKGAAGTVLVATHTDGQNAIEENGGPAILALADYLTRFSRASRPRDVQFLFTPNHMISGAATVKPDRWLEAHPEIEHTLGMALVPEHLGALEWWEDPSAGYVATGRSELVAVPVGNSRELQRLAVTEMKASNLERAIVVRPREGGLYGEGTFTYRRGLPTVAFITGPAYLVQVARDGDLAAFDRSLMHRQVVFLARLLSRMLALPAARPA